MRSRRTLLILVIAAAVLAATYFLPLDGRRLSVVASMATALATIAALLSALASNQAAKESASAAQQATRALSYASKPKVELFLKEELGQRYAVIENVSPHRAEGLVLAWRLVGGVEGTRRLDVLDGMSLTSRGLSFGHRGPMQSVGLPGFIPGPGAVERLWLRYLGTTGPTVWIADFEFGPGISEEDRFDHRYYRPRRLVADRELDQMSDSIRFQSSTAGP